MSLPRGAATAVLLQVCRSWRALPFVLANEHLPSSATSGLPEPQSGLLGPMPRNASLSCPLPALPAVVYGRGSYGLLAARLPAFCLAGGSSGYLSEIADTVFQRFADGPSRCYNPLIFSTGNSKPAPAKAGTPTESLQPARFLHRQFKAGAG